MTRADLDKSPADVAAMFDDVAERYDLTNDVLSLGQDRRWRTRGRRARSTPQPGERVLDLAAGTGTSSQPFAEAGRARGARATSRSGMLAVGKRARPALPFVGRRRAPGCRSPTTTFDAVTISFGLRNVVDPDAGLREMLRVTRPGGRLVVCEFSHPTWAPFRTVYVEYLMRALPAGRPRGVRRTRTPTSTWPSRSGPGPTRPALADRIARGRLAATSRWRNLSGGIVALHRATRLSPAAAGRRSSSGCLRSRSPM